MCVQMGHHGAGASIMAKCVIVYGAAIEQWQTGPHTIV